MQASERACGCNLNFPSTTLIELAGRAGFDFVTFDGEHGPFTPQDLDDLCRVADMAAARATDLFLYGAREFLKAHRG
jgi:2-keto-3-deoxy-L-rhamnonate aldolase RhmA